jgi:hypothetical protein
MRLIALAVLACVAATCRDASACSTDGRATSRAAAAPDVFTWFETAASVGEVVVSASPGFTIEGHGKAGDVTVTLRAALAGKPAKKTTFKQNARPCSGHSKGAVLIGFFDAAGRPIGFAGKTTRSAITSWKAAKTDGAKRALLAKLEKSHDPDISGAATKKLSTLPAIPAWAVPPSTWKSSAASAVAHVTAQWPTLVQAAAVFGKFDPGAKGTCKLAAVKQACAKQQEHLHDVEGPDAKPHLGEMSSLADGQCWVTTCSVGFYTAFIYVDADDGRVLGGWVPPEG